MEPASKKTKVNNATGGCGGDEVDSAAFPLPIEVISIPTKTYDGGSPRYLKLKPTEDATPNGHQDLKLKDPFLYYSNKANRSSYLSLRPHDEEIESERPIVRKTRLSFEVHPDLLLFDDNMLFNVAAAVVRERGGKE